MNSSSSQVLKKDFRQDINSLRAWAVVAVVLYHFGVPGFSGGFVGVDIFFIISGFLMTNIIVRGLSEGHFSIWQFYLARARRIIPALAVLAMALLFLGWFTLPSTDYRMLGKHVAASLGFLSNIVFWLEAGYFDAASKEKWLLHTWSLSVEWQFYLILPLVLLAAWKLWPGRDRITPLVALGFIVSLALSIGVTPGHSSAAFYLLPTRAWEMLAGGLVYLLAHRCPTGARGKLLEWLGFGLIVTSVLMLDEGANWPGAGALLPVAGAVLVLMAAQSGSPWTNNRLVQWLGNASYSLYLWHWPVVVALVYLGIDGEAVAVSIGLVLTVVLGHLSYVLVETPTRRHLGQLKMGTGAAILAAATVAVAAPGTVVQANGFHNRLPPSVEVAALEARNRNPRLSECHGDNGGESPSCIYGGAELSAVVMGDSHATAIVTSVEMALPGKADGVLELSYSGCPTLLGAKRHPNHQMHKGHQCEQFNQWILKKMRDIPKHVPLIIVNRTSVYAYGPNDKKRVNEKSPIVYFSKPYESPTPEFLEEFTEHLIASACQFAQDREVYLVRPIPEMGIDVPKTMSRPTPGGQQADVSITLDEYHARHSVVWTAQNAAGRRCGVKILDPLPYLCHDGRCQGDKDGRPLYFDDNHLSEFGNRLLIPMFTKVFVAAEHKIQTAQTH